MDLDDTKNYILMQDNGDGTMMQTMHFPEADVHLTSIVELSMDQFFTLMFSSTDTTVEKLTQDISPLLTEIPNSTENL